MSQSSELAFTKKCGKDLYGHMLAENLLEYNSVITGDTVRSVLHLKYPKVGTREQFSRIALLELSAVDYVRNQLLNQGKYLQTNAGNYRVLLPSEHKAQCERYIAAAQAKLRKSVKLSTNTPPEDYDLTSSTVRAKVKLKSVRQNID